MRSKLIIFFFVWYFSITQAWAEAEKKENTQNIFYRITEITYLKMVEINLKNHINLWENKKSFSDKSLKEQDEVFSCTDIYLRLFYVDFLKESGYKSSSPLSPSLDEMEQELKKDTKKIKDKNLDCKGFSKSPYFVDLLINVSPNLPIDKDNFYQ